VRCAGCELPGNGYTHSCAGSGTFAAAEAYASSAVEEIAQAWPYFHVDITFKMRALDDRMVREKMTPLVSALLEDDTVEGSEFSVRPLEPAKRKKK